MLINSILTLFLSFFLTLETYSNKILIKDSLVVESLTLSKDELINMIINNYNIPDNYNEIEINTNYLKSPQFNKIYSVELIVQYDDNIINYNLKLKTINSNIENKNDNSTIIVFLISLIVIFLIIYIKRSN